MNAAVWTVMVLSIGETLNRSGWTVMILSVGSVLSLVSYCLYRVLSLPPVEVEEHLKGPLEIDTQDTYDAD